MNGTADTLDLSVDSGIDRHLLREHLAHIAASPQFASASKLIKFLTFVVETVLAGQGDQIKESLIAVEVYGRRPDYNPQIDSTVRVEAGCLRARLRQYYETSAEDQPFEIELPKGRYVPVFRRREEPVADRHDKVDGRVPCFTPRSRLNRDHREPAGSFLPASSWWRLPLLF